MAHCHELVFTARGYEYIITIIISYILSCTQTVRRQMRSVWRTAGSQRARDARRTQPRLSRRMFRVRGLHAAAAERPAVRGQSWRRTAVLSHGFRKRNISDAADRGQPSTRYIMT